jgi:type I restriction enzyme S subunit
MNPELRFKDQDGNAFPDWEEKKIDKVCRIQTGSGNTQDKEDDGIYPFYVRSPIVEHSNKYIFECESVLTVGDGVGVGNVYHYANGKFNCHQRVYAMNEFNGISGKYFYYFFSTHFGARVKSMTAKTSVDSVRKDMIAKMDIQMPNDMKEQSKIATLLSDIDKKIESQATLVEKLKNTKDAMLVKMFPQGESKVPEIRFDGFSGDWKKIDVRYLINEAIIEKPMDGNHGEKHPVSSEYVEDGIPFLMASDVKDGKVDLDNCKFISKSRAEKLDKGFARNNDVLLTHKATIGETAILTGLNTEYAMLTPQVTYYRIIDNKKLNHFYLYSAFMSKQFQKDIHIAATQSTRSYIGIVKQHKLKIWFPIDIQEQEKIGQFFSNLDKEIEINQQKYEKLGDIKKALLSKLFPTKEDE